MEIRNEKGKGGGLYRDGGGGGGGVSERFWSINGCKYLLNG